MLRLVKKSNKVQKVSKRMHTSKEKEGLRGKFLLTIVNKAMLNRNVVKASSMPSWQQVFRLTGAVGQ